MPAILIVENDDLEMRFINSVIQETLGEKYAQVAVRTGTQAVYSARQHQPELILTDVLLPDMDGIDLIRELRKFLPESCISILTACTDFYRAQRAIHLRVHEYMLKPVKPRDLKAVLEGMAQLAAGKSPSGKEAKALFPSTGDVNKDSRALFIEDSLQYICEHYGEKISLEDTARRVFINTQYFSRVFRRDVGMTFTEYLNSLRVKAACKLLVSTNYPVYRVASECGFSDSSYFNRVFLRYMEMTPQRYRRLHRSYPKPEKPDKKP